MNTEDIKMRNLFELESVIINHKLKYSLEEILTLQSVFIDFKEEWGFRVFATNLEMEPFDKFDENGESIGVGTKAKQIKLNLFNFLKKKVDKSTQEEIYTVRAEFIRFVIAWNQLRMIRDLEHAENLMEFSEMTARNQFITKLTYK